MSDINWAKLQEPFAPNQIGKLPKRTCRNCGNAPGKVCKDHEKKKCQSCGNYMTTAHIDLDYVGHAQVTGRLLEVDPAWTWEPYALDAQGFPAVIEEQNGRRILWIKMTVGGVTRPGVGIVDSAKSEVEKELISDAIRNAAMRFGVALDLWAKGDLHADDHEPPAPSPRTEKPEAPAVDWKALGWDDKDAHDAALEQARSIARRLPDPHHDNVKAWVKDEAGPLPYSSTFMDEWMDMMDALTLPEDPLPAVDEPLPSVQEALA